MIRNKEFTQQAERDEPGLAAQMVAHVRTSIIATLVLAVIVCGIYPAIVWGLASALPPPGKWIADQTRRNQYGQ